MFFKWRTVVTFIEWMGMSYHRTIRKYMRMLVMHFQKDLKGKNYH